MTCEPNWPYKHAGILELGDDPIFDTTEQRWYRACDYPGTEHVRYTPKEVRKLICETGHWGPWSAAEVAAILRTNLRREVDQNRACDAELRWALSRKG